MTRVNIYGTFAAMIVCFKEASTAEPTRRACPQEAHYLPSSLGGIEGQ
jgi:hypothetical protein